MDIMRYIFSQFFVFLTFNYRQYQHGRCANLRLEYNTSTIERSVIMNYGNADSGVTSNERARGEICDEPPTNIFFV
jgi:hypothetical protein